jgi:parallel beta-helix repeat protein
MKTNSVKLLLVVLLSTFILHPSSLLAQGALTPPGAPAPTMKTLAQVEPRTPISSAPFTISAPGSYYLTTNLTGASSVNGITISSGNVTLDLNGFVLQGVAGSWDGVHVGTYTNITVRNGTITGWGYDGVDADNGSLLNVVFERLTVSANGSYGIDTAAGSVVRDCCSVSNHLDGIYCDGGLVSGCVSRNNGGSGIYVYYCIVRDCQVENNSSSGIYAQFSTVRDCLMYGNSRGVYAQQSTVSDCYVENSQKSGIYIYLRDCQITGNNCFNNNTGASTNEAGIYIDDNDNRVEDNHVTGSGYAGIMVGTDGTYSKNVIIKNTVTGNGANNYLTPGNQAVGPLITTYGTITNSNPWANFSF